jgi:hypothetical protein
MKVCDICLTATEFLRTKGHRVTLVGPIGIWQVDEIEVSDLGLLELALRYDEWLTYAAERKASTPAL